MGIGKRLVYLRKQQHLSQEMLAKELGISKSAIGFYELDEREPSFEMLTKIADYFNVDMNYLFGFNKKSGIETTGRARMEEVIVVETTVGDGKKSPITAVRQYWTKSGKMIGHIRV